MIFSKKLTEKLLGMTLTVRTKTSFISSVLYYIFDSKERSRKRLDRWLSYHVEFPHPKLVDLAEQFRRNCKSEDDRILKIQSYVLRRVKYQSDMKVWGKSEYWASPYETWDRKLDDCDGINGLIYNLAILSGINPVKLFVGIGEVSTQNIGHFWLIYLSTKYVTWYSIDGTYNIDTTAFEYRVPFSLAKDNYAKIWYIFNTEHIFKPR